MGIYIQGKEKVLNFLSEKSAELYEKSTIEDDFQVWNDDNGVICISIYGITFLDYGKMVIGGKSLIYKGGMLDALSE